MPGHYESDPEPGPVPFRSYRITTEEAIDQLAARLFKAYAGPALRLDDPDLDDGVRRTWNVVARAAVDFVRAQVAVDLGSVVGAVEAVLEAWPERLGTGRFPGYDVCEKDEEIEKNLASARDLLKVAIDAAPPQEGG